MSSVMQMHSVSGMRSQLVKWKQEVGSTRSPLFAVRVIQDADLLYFTLSSRSPVSISSGCFQSYCRRRILC